MVQAITGKARARDGCELFYRLHAQAGKPRLALVHSLALDGSIWDGVVEELANDAEILVYDCRGHGRSERRPGAYTTALFADDLADLLDHCGWPAAVVAGCSMGGCVTQAFGAAYPERAKGLMLIDTTAWYGTEAPEKWRQRAATAAEKGFAKMLPFQLSRWFSDNFPATHADRVKTLSNIFLANDLACFQSSCALLGSADLREAIGRLRMPVSVVVGEQDGATTPAMAQAIQTAIAGATLTVVPDCRHLTPVENPRKVAELLRDLFARGPAK